VATPPERGDWVEVTGHWFLDRTADWEPPAPLLEFLQAGTPPVYAGFGGMSIDRREATAVVEGLSGAGQRGIVLQTTAAAHGAELPRDIFAISDVPHDWLFQHVAAAVHHGGSGVTAATFRAGIPSVVVPYFADHPFWARRVYDLGVGPVPLSRRRLSAEQLAQAIRLATTDVGMRERAAALGERIRSEDGLARAVEAFERQVVVLQDPFVITQRG
jgi:sterol 3beta-glucosyltransferase